jgi:hypothetical protein
MAERRASAGGNGVSGLDFMEKSERHFPSVASLGYAWHAD